MDTYRLTIGITVHPSVLPVKCVLTSKHLCTVRSIVLYLGGVKIESV